MSKNDYGGEADIVAGARKFTQAKGLPDPYRAYALHKKGAELRGIAWGFTFASWWVIWQPYFHMRGNKSKNHLCMAREKDEGAYEPGNVYLTTIMGNTEDYHKRCARAITARQQAKEAREAREARATSRYVGHKQQAVSDLTRVAHHGEKSTCNYRDEPLEWELSAL